MTQEELRRVRRKKRFKKNIKRTIYQMLIAPAGWPRLSAPTLNLMMKLCELAGVVLVVAILACMVSAGVVVKTVGIISAILFAFSFIMIQLQMYQNNLENHGYDIRGKAF